MYWPRLQLTKDEQKRWCVYAEPGKAQRPALYRAYGGEINVSAQSPEDIETIQISRRARVVALTASGDVFNMAVQMSDSGGEQYTMGWTPLTNMLAGLNADPRGMNTFDTTANPAGATAINANGPKRLSLGMVFGGAFCLAPHIFEPNIVLLPNQTLSIKGRALNPPTALPKFNSNNGAEVVRDGRAHVSFTIHAWEFQLE